MAEADRQQEWYEARKAALISAAGDHYRRIAQGTRRSTPHFLTGILQRVHDYAAQKYEKKAAEEEKKAQMRIATLEAFKRNPRLNAFLNFCLQNFAAIPYDDVTVPLQTLRDGDALDLYQETKGEQWDGHPPLVKLALIGGLNAASGTHYEMVLTGTNQQFLWNESRQLPRKNRLGYRPTVPIVDMGLVNAAYQLLGLDEYIKDIPTIPKPNDREQYRTYPISSQDMSVHFSFAGQRTFSSSSNGRPLQTYFSPAHISVQFLKPKKN